MAKEIDLPTEATHPTQTQQPIQIRIDDSKAVSLYSNFCRLKGMPEELIIDFGLNPEGPGVPTQPIVVSQRIILSVYTAKRLLKALSDTMENYEKVFGYVEPDYQKRVRPQQRG